MENFREDIARYRDDWRSGRSLDWNADVPAQDKTYVISDAGAVVCSDSCGDNSKIYESDITVIKS